VVRIFAASSTCPTAPILNVGCLEGESGWQAKEKRLKGSGLPSSLTLKTTFGDSRNVQDFA
jgi:hypothetical protein